MLTWDSAANRVTNSYFSLTLEPRHGGRVVSLHTPSGELTTGAAPADLLRPRVPYKFGLLSVQLWQDSYWHNDLCHRRWSLGNLDVTPTRVEVTVAGDSVLWAGVGVTRRFVFTDDPWIDVHHELNPGSTTGPYEPPAFWFSNVMRGRGRTYVPGPAGVLDYPRWPQDQSWCQEPTDGWIAWLDHTGGLAFVTDPAHLRHVRVCHQDNDRVDWVRRRVDTVENTTVRLVPFSGLDRVDGVGPAGIVAVDRTRGGLAVGVYPLLTGRARLTIERVAPDGTVSPADVVGANLTAGSACRIAIQFRGAPGVWWQGTLEVVGPRGRAITTFVARGEDLAGYLRGMLPAVPATASVTELPRDKARLQPPRSFNFNAVPVPLPQPRLSRRGANPRVLAFVQPRDTVSLQALSRQFEFDLTLPFLPRTAPSTEPDPRYDYELGDRFASLFRSELMNAWTAALDTSLSYDVIVMGVYGGAEGWALLPQALQANILTRVQAGTGLVVIRRSDVGPDPGNPQTTALRELLPLVLQSSSDFHGPFLPRDDRTVRGLPWTILPGFTPYIMGYSYQAGAVLLLEIDYAGTPMPLLARSTYGAGRVLDLGWGPTLVPPDRSRQRLSGTEGMDTLGYDLALLARIICDAAGRDPAIAVRSVTLAGNNATVEVEHVQPAASAFDLVWEALDRFGLSLGGGRIPSTVPAPSPITFPIPSGAWTVDVVVQPDVGEPGWGAGGRILDLAITTTPDLAVLGRQDSVRITPAAVAGATQYAVELLDGRGRVLTREIVGAGVSAAVDAARIETPRAEVRVHALDSAGQLIGQAFRLFRVRGRTGMERWPIHFWNNAGVVLPQPLLLRHLETYSSLGVSAYFLLPPLSPSNDDIVAVADRLAIPYVGESSGWLWTPRDGLSLTDGEAIAKGMTSDTNLAASLADTNILYYRVADDEPDSPATDAGYDARTLARFGAWLSEWYGYADSALQREWGAAFTLATATPLSHNAAVTAFNDVDPTYAPWVDLRRFMMDLFSSAPSQARQALRRSDPEALAGTSGDNRTAMAVNRDWSVRGRALDVVGRYAPSTAIELKALGTKSIPWTGYDDPDPIIRHRVWSMLGLGEDGLALFGETTLVNPDLTLPEVGRDLAAALLPVRRGVGGLFAASQSFDDGVFVLVSADSSAVLAIHGYETLGDWFTGTAPKYVDLGGDAREGVHELLAAMGVGWNAISPTDVETGALEKSRVKVLILPMCAALSDAACEAIRRWVANGGQLIADLLPGVFTAHGRLRGTGIAPQGSLQGSTNPLDGVFGVIPGARPPITNDTVSLNAGLEFPVRCLDSVSVASAALPGGTGAGGAPVWFQNAHDLGQAAYLGCSVFADYHYWNAVRPARLLMEEAFSALLRRLGVTPHAQVVDSAGRRVELCQFYVRSAGLAELVVLLRHINGIYDPVALEADGELVFSTRAHTYDLDHGVYLGYGNQLSLRISAYTFRAFARLPYRVEGLDVVVRDSPLLGDTVMVNARLTVAGAPTHGHRFRLDVRDSSGRPLRYLARELAAECGAATFTVPTAFNDPSGVWTIVVTDVTTGIRGTVSLDLGPRAPTVSAPEPFQVDAVDD